MKKNLLKFSGMGLALVAAIGMSGCAATGGGAKPMEVGITADIPSVEVMHGGEKVTIQRNQNTDNNINPAFAKTSRKCPPFCIHPMEPVPGVTTVGELELLEFLKNRVEKGAGMLIDSRVESFYVKGTIPGSINIPFTAFSGDDRDPNFREAMAKLGAMRGESVNWSDSVHRSADDLGEKNRKLAWDFSRAKDVLLFCNGPWCDQSPRAIRALVKVGYPVNKIFYYRGGMQDWLLLGLSVAMPTPIGSTTIPARTAAPALR